MPFVAHGVLETSAAVWHVAQVRVSVPPFEMEPPPPSGAVVAIELETMGTVVVAA
jgi:hypothetical protein